MVTIPSIRASVENKSFFVKDKHVLHGDFLRDRKGRLLSYAGGFSVVYPYVTTNGEKWAFRCWHADISNSQDRYEAIAEVVRVSHLPFLTEFIYERVGIVVESEEFPTIRMKWVDGETLKKYICAHKSSADDLSKLAENFLYITREMHSRSLAHGDLQHGNIIVSSDGMIHLIDYDSFFCPALKGESDTVTGLQDYQHPSRKTNKVVSDKLDYFSELVIYLSIKAMAARPSLIEKYNVAETEYLLFTKEDYIDLEHSAIYSDISSLGGEFRELLNILKGYLSCTEIDQLQPFEVLMMEGRIIFSVSPTKAVRNQEKVTLSWEVPFEATVSVLQESKKKTLATDKKGTLTFALGDNVIFKIIAKTTKGNTIEKQAAVTVFDKGDISFTADKMYVFPHIPIRLSWEAKNVIKIWFNGKEVEAVGHAVVEQEKATTYIVKAIDEFGEIEKRLEVGMLPIPQVKAIMVPTPTVTNNISITIHEPKLSVEVKFPQINMHLITAEVPRVKSFTELGYASECGLPMVHRKGLSELLKKLLKKKN